VRARSALRDGVRFGVAGVLVNGELGHALLEVEPAEPGCRPQRVWLHGLEEVEGALGAQVARMDRDDRAGDMVAALRFAAQQLAGSRRDR